MSNEKDHEIVKYGLKVKKKSTSNIVGVQRQASYKFFFNHHIQNAKIFK